MSDVDTSRELLSNMVGNTSSANTLRNINNGLDRDARKLADMADSLWDCCDVHPDVALEANRLADIIRDGLNDDNMNQALDFFELMSRQAELGPDAVEQAASAAFLVSLNLANANIVTV